MTSPRATTGILLVVIPVVFTLGFTGLQMTFDYPEILRRPASEVLIKFAAAGADLHLYWYAMMAAALTMIPATIGAALLWWRQDHFLAALSAGFGILAGIVQSLGLLRWVMLVPTLAAAYTAPGATEIQQANATAIFDAANAYLGMGVGEHLGYLFTSLWTLVVALLLMSSRRYVAIAGLVVATGVAVGMLEPFGVPLAGQINAISFTLWALWTLVVGVLVLRAPNATPATAPAVA